MTVYCDSTPVTVYIPVHLFDKEKFIVKLTPIHETKEATDRKIITESGYVSYDIYRKFEDPLLSDGWDVIVFIPSIEEDIDRITCGNALLRDFVAVKKT